MKKKNGFTLIELLAVIVILAIIALIAVPIIMNVINEAKKGAAKDSMYGYVEAIELEIAKAMLTDQNLLTGNYTTKAGDLYSGSTKALSVSFKGTKPEDNGTVTLTNGRVTKAELTFGGHTVTYNGNKVDGETGTTTPTPDSVYANIGEQVTVKGLTGTFHVIKQVMDSDTMALIIADTPHSMGAFSTGSNEFSGSLAEQELNEYTATWKSDIEKVGGKTSGLIISIPSKEELQTVRAFYGFEEYDDYDNIDWLHITNDGSDEDGYGNSGAITYTKSSDGTENTWMYQWGRLQPNNPKWYLTKYKGYIRPTLYIDKSNLTKVS